MAYTIETIVSHYKMFLVVGSPRDVEWLNNFIKDPRSGFPGGAVVESPPANAGDMGSGPGPGRSQIKKKKKKDPRSC